MDARGLRRARRRRHRGADLPRPTRPRSARTCSGTPRRVAVICEDAAQLAKVERVRGECPALEHVVLIEGEAAGTVPLAELRRLGAERADDVIERRLAGVEPSDVATIVYTSGTTGPPKGCVTTHGNLRTTAAMYERELELGDDLSIYLYLPLAHSLARVAQAVALQVGGTLAFWGGDAKKIIEEVAQAEPTHFPSVPRVYEKIHTAVLSGVGRAEPPAARALFAWALEVGRAVGGPAAQRQADGTPRPRAPRRGRPARAVEGARRCSAAGCSSP